ILPFMKLEKSAFAGSKVDAIGIDYTFTDNPGHRETEKYVTRVEDWVHARLDSLHARSTYSYFGHNEARTRVYLQSRWANDDGARALRKRLREGLPVLPGCRLEIEGGEGQEGGPSTLEVHVFGEPGPRLDDLNAEVRRRLSLIPGLADVRIGNKN